MRGGSNANQTANISLSTTGQCGKYMLPCPPSTKCIQSCSTLKESMNERGNYGRFRVMNRCGCGEALKV